MYKSCVRCFPIVISILRETIVDVRGLLFKTGYSHFSSYDESPETELALSRPILFLFKHSRSPNLLKMFDAVAESSDFFRPKRLFKLTRMH